MARSITDRCPSGDRQMMGIAGRGVIAAVRARGCHVRETEQNHNACGHDHAVVAIPRISRVPWPRHAAIEMRNITRRAQLCRVLIDLLALRARHSTWSCGGSRLL